MRAKAISTNTTEGATGPSERTFSLGGHILTAPKPVPGLYLVATPIGNLGDITLRALETLAGVDIVACEDTRITRRLTERYAIAALLKPYHEHNAALARPKILQRLAQGASIALVSDAATLVMFESGNRVQDTLADLAGIMGARDAAICREMTKMHEEVRRAPVSELARAADTQETRGEFVLVIGTPAAGTQIMTEHELDDLLRSSLQRDSVKDAVAHAVELSGRPRREIYARALELAKELDKEADKRAGAEGDDGKG